MNAIWILILFQPCPDPAAEEGPAGAPGGEDQAADQECGGITGTNVSKTASGCKIIFTSTRNICTIIPIPIPPQTCSKAEKQDVEDLEVPQTKRLFLTQHSLESQKIKEEKEYLDALNKEVTSKIKSHTNKIVER